MVNYQEYTLIELTIEFGGSEFNRLEDFYVTENNDVAVGSSVRNSYPMLDGASTVDVRLYDTELVSGFSDINLYLTNEVSVSTLYP